MFWLDFVGVFAFALSGGVVGVRRHFDIFGILVLAFVTALGGGIMRDVMLGITPPRNLTNLPLITTALVAGLVAFWFSGSLDRARKVILTADALGLGTFAVTGTLASVAIGHPGVEAIAVGVITAVGGGVLRDVLAGQVPGVFGRDLYAIPALLGAFLTDLTVRLHGFNSLTQWAIVLLVFGLRMGALKFHWHSPTPRRLDRD